MDNKGQVTIYIIIAILIISAIVLIFFVLFQPPQIQIHESNPVPFIESCARKATEDALEIMLPQGGFIEPGNYKIYQNTKIEYLCDNTGNYLPCVNQHPVFIQTLESEIHNYIQPIIQQCFIDLRNNLQDRNNQVELGRLNINVDLGPERAKLNIQRQLTISKGQVTQTFSNFKTEILTPIYDLASVANEIASQEAKYCYFEYVGYMVLYPKFDIKAFTMSDSTAIYTIEDKPSRKIMNIAIRSCAIPPGI
jgi:hypothetical protein